MQFDPVKLHPAARRIWHMADVAQRTPEWYDARRNLLTASDVAAALGIKPFPSYAGDPREDCLKKKLDNHPFTSIHVRHGQKYEDEARDLLCGLVGTQAFDKGLVIHPTEPWIGASPDGVTTCGKLVEIKCPLQRQIVPGHVPHHYYPQVQVQMEVLDCDACYFAQYKPGFLTNTGRAFLDIVCVERDRKWWASNRDSLHGFWKEYQDRLQTHVPRPPPADPKCLVVDALYEDSM